VTTFTEFTDVQWAAIQSARADWPAGINWPAVRRKLERARRDYWTMRANRQRRPPKAERAQLQRALKHLHELDQFVVKLGIKPTFTGLQHELENRLALYEARSSEHFGGHRDAYRDLLHLRIIQQWTGQLRVSSSFHEPWQRCRAGGEISHGSPGGDLG
jgi:hypothetical protein